MLRQSARCRAKIYARRAKPLLIRDSDPRPAAASTSGEKRTEGCKSGLSGEPGKLVYGKPYRGFESHPLRQEIERFESRDPSETTSCPAVQVLREPNL